VSLRDNCDRSPVYKKGWNALSSRKSPRSHLRAPLRNTLALASPSPCTAAACVRNTLHHSRAPHPSDLPSTLNVSFPRELSTVHTKHLAFHSDSNSPTHLVLFSISCQTSHYNGTQPHAHPYTLHNAPTEAIQSRLARCSVPIPFTKWRRDILLTLNRNNVGADSPATRGKRQIRSP
jgi:hypothetical protein